MSLQLSERATAIAVSSEATTKKAPRSKAGRILRARIGARSVTLDLLTSHGKPQVLAHIKRDHAPSKDSNGGVPPTGLTQAVPGLQTALSALQREEGSLRGMICNIIIDDSWMLYDVVRADLRGQSAGAAHALIGASLADLAGIEVSALITRWQPQGKNPFTLACGLPADALPAIQQALSEKGVIAGSIEGEFVFEYNCNRQHIEPISAVLALVRDAGTQMAVIIGGVLISMSYELGVSEANELELRGRAMLRVAGLRVEDPIRFYALSPQSWTAAHPWVCLSPAA